ncbi:MAG: nucleotidyl transferase AbiEii/AbiGii toxin family protein [Deltaproteobacteria bacterium]|nr:nucleotidyl transferase AbiEii/AbiGii toxin family protein [Deltaproteobacteria bacterium]MCB9788008.1 nucleotidyl transferase AbiEii/AbiGii toxin family protein [Deltaproteobacteria bacterium]
MDYKVIGGAALALHGLARATEDLDLLVDPTDTNIARLREALRTLFDDPNVDEIVASEMRGEYPAIQYIPPGRPFHLDLLAKLGDAFDYPAIEAEFKTFEGVRVCVATPRMLHQMKRSTVRPKDRVDATRLAEAFGLEG